MGEYKYIFVPFIALVICQFIKFAMESLKHKSLNWNRLINGAGGMPSSHATFSMSLTTLLAYNYGFDNPLVATALIFSFIVCYDAMGVRFESGKQAEVINDIADVVEKQNKFKKIKFADLKEQLGHKPLEVIMGMLLGITLALLFEICIF